MVSRLFYAVPFNAQCTFSWIFTISDFVSFFSAPYAVLRPVDFAFALDSEVPKMPAFEALYGSLRCSHSAVRPAYPYFAVSLQ